ncbi:hypothetical protein D3C78_1281970 [compost metagenome]
MQIQQLIVPIIDVRFLYPAVIDHGGSVTISVIAVSGYLAISRHRIHPIRLIVGVLSCKTSFVRYRLHITYRVVRVSYLYTTVF